MLARLRFSAEPNKRLRRAVVLLLGVLGGLAIAGPSGVIAWREHAQVREQRATQLAALDERRGMLRHRVELLNPDRADPDLVSELIRRNLNVVHPDEVIVNIEPRD